MLSQGFSGRIIDVHGSCLLEYFKLGLSCSSIVDIFTLSKMLWDVIVTYIHALNVTVN